MTSVDSVAKVDNGHIWDTQKSMRMDSVASPDALDEPRHAANDGIVQLGRVRQQRRGTKKKVALRAVTGRFFTLRRAGYVHGGCAN